MILTIQKKSGKEPLTLSLTDIKISSSYLTLMDFLDNKTGEDRGGWRKIGTVRKGKVRREKKRVMGKEWAIQ
jgi:hypothetical protein